MKTVFPHYKDRSLLDFETGGNPRLEGALNIARSYVDDLKGMTNEGMGLTFVGPNGVGKTHLACAVLSAAKGAGYKIECIEMSTWIDLHHELWWATDMLKRSQSEWVSDHFEEIEDKAYAAEGRLQYIKMEARFLLLDDVGREHQSQSGWSSEQVFDLIRFRHNRGLPTLITTNQTWDALDARYTEGLGSYLQEATIPVVMEGEDYRFKIHAARTARD